MESAHDRGPAAADPESRVALLMCLHTQQQSALSAIRAQIRSARAAADRLQERLLANSSLLAVAAATLVTVPRSVQAYVRSERWFEDTLPHLPAYAFKQSFRVTPSTFRYLVDVCRPHMERQETCMRSSIAVEKRVGVSLYKLCSSAGDRTVANLFALGRSTVNETCKEFCRVILSALEHDWLKMVSAAELDDHIREFHAAQEFPHGVGALDACHFPVSPPKTSGSDYHNSMGWYSIILLALVDHRHRFRYVDVGTPGRRHDAFRRSALAGILEGPTFQTSNVSINGTAVPPLILCDRAFPLTSNMMKPYPRNVVAENTPQAVFNERLSSARRVVQDALRKLKARFRFIMKRTECDVNNVRLIIRACCVLNNVCEHLDDSVEPQWLEEAEKHDEDFEQPLCNTDDEAGNGPEVRDAIAAYLHRHASSSTN